MELARKSTFATRSESALLLMSGGGGRSFFYTDTRLCILR
jgi:hypothetical protein